MEKVTRCKACRRKNTMQEVEAEGQVAMQCTNCTWLDPGSIRNVEDQSIAGDGRGGYQ